MIDIETIQRALREDENQLDGWLLYDFHGSNPISRSIAKVDTNRKLTTRRWFYLIPTDGVPCALVHQIEPDSLSHLPGNRQLYSGRKQFENSLARLIRGHSRLAMEYSQDCNIPYISKVDAGTVETLRSHGISILSSGNLVQRFESTWDDHALETHQNAAGHLEDIKNRAFKLIADRLSTKSPVNEYEVQQIMVDWFKEADLVSDSAPVVAAQENSGNPHYLPTSSSFRPINPNELVLIDLWGKQNVPNAVYADITWVGFTGANIPNQYSKCFNVAARARDTAVLLVKDAFAEGKSLEGWEVDRKTRTVIEKAGFGENFVHRTGHSLGKEVHGNGVHLDDFETHDDRRLIEGSGFTIEPGIYFEEFGVRTEINMYIGKYESTVTSSIQESILSLSSMGCTID